MLMVTGCAVPIRIGLSTPLFNRYGCVGRSAGEWVVRAGAGGRLGSPGGILVGCRGRGVTQSEHLVAGRESAGAGQVTLTGRKVRSMGRPDATEGQSFHGEEIRPVQFDGSEQTVGGAY